MREEVPKSPVEIGLDSEGGGNSTRSRLIPMVIYSTPGREVPSVRSGSFSLTSLDIAPGVPPKSSNDLSTRPGK